MKWLLTLFIALSALCSCDRKDLQVKDYSFDTTYSMVDTICWKDERIALQLSIDNYNAEEELKASSPGGRAKSLVGIDRRSVKFRFVELFIV